MISPMLHMGLTGNIASGKSHATQVFAELGARIIDADVIAHGLLVTGTPTYARVVDSFGQLILNSDKSINRKVLGEIVFGDAERRATLNGIIHPEVRVEVQRQIALLANQHPTGIVIVDAALMVESGSYKMYDRLIVVYCDPMLQLGRLMAREGLNAEQAKARINSQLSVGEKLKLAHYRIDTSGTFRDTRQQIEAVYRELVLLELERRDT